MKTLAVKFLRNKRIFYNFNLFLLLQVVPIYTYIIIKKSKIAIISKKLNIFKGPEGKRGQQGRRGPKVS